MQPNALSRLESAAAFLSSKTGKVWTQESILCQLQTLLTGYCDGIGLDTVSVFLPSGWKLEDALTGEATSFRNATIAEISNAGDFVGLLAAFDDAGAANGYPLAIVIGTRRYRSSDPIYAEQIRLTARNIRALAEIPYESVLPYHDLVNELQDGLRPDLECLLECRTAPHVSADTDRIDTDQEAPVERRARLKTRKVELKSQGVKGWLKQIAEEEGLSTARIKQLLADDKRANAGVGSVDAWQAMVMSRR